MYLCNFTCTHINSSVVVYTRGEVVPISEARRKANHKYIGTLDEIKIRIPLGMREEIKKIAEEKKYSLNGYIKKLISDDTGLDL